MSHDSSAPNVAEFEPRITEWLTAEEAASYLKVNRRTLLKWVREGKIKAHVLSGTYRRVWRFLQNELDGTLRSPSVLGNGRVN